MVSHTIRRPFFPLATIVALVLCVYPIHAQRPDDAARTIAQNGLQSFLQKIQPGTETKYGFHDRSELSSAVVGSPLRMFTIHPDSIREEIKPGKHYVVPMDEWKVPVVVGGKPRAFLTVARVKGTLMPVEFGGAELAQELSVVEKHHPGSVKSLLRLYQLQCDFLILRKAEESADEGNLYPLQSAKISFPEQTFDANTPQSLQQLLPVVRQHYVERFRSGIRQHK